jgi:VWFA-related protein
MRRLRPFLFIYILCISHALVVSQDSLPVSIGVALLQAGPNTISVADARDQIVKALNQHKPDKKLAFTVIAIPLSAEWGPKAFAEAREKTCQFVIATHLTSLRTSSALNNDGAQGLNYRPDYSAAVEYRLIRVADGAGFAIGSVQEEDPTSAQAAAQLTIAHVAREAMSQIAKGGNVPHRATPESSRSNGELRAGSAVFVTARPCAWLPDNVPHAEAVRAICQYALELPQTMPNFVCDQDTSRYRGKNTVPFDLLTAQIRYENGKESYDEISLNGKPAPEALTNSPGLWSTGQFGSDLRSIFDPWNLAVFEFSKESKIGDRTVWVFTYRIARQFDPLWRLHGENGVLAPSYKGELWVDQEGGKLLRFTSAALEIPPAFAMAAASLEIDYANVAFSDGSSFVLPSDFTVNTTYRHEDPTRNIVRFRNCHKFRAKTQIVLNVPGKKTAEDGIESVTSAAVQDTEDDEAERIYAILREQAIREDQVALDRENKRRLDLGTVLALRRLSALGQQQPQGLAGKTPAPETSAPADKPETTIKVSVKLVPVTVVLRDGKGRAVGNRSKDDFQLFDNGKPQPIESFTIEKSGEAALSESLPSTSSEPSAPAVLSSGAPAPDRYVAYVFDDIHSSFEDLAAAREAARSHLAAMRPGDRAGIFTTSGNIGLDFTAERARLIGALNALRPHPFAPAAMCPPVSNYMADLIVNQDDREALGLAARDEINCAFGGMTGDEARAEQIAKSTAMQVLSASSAENQAILGDLREIFRRSAAAPGVRSVVLVSPGFLMTSPETRQAIMDLIENALRSEIVVNTLDVRGLYTPVVAPNMAHPANPIVRFRYDREEAEARSEIMAELAYSTGGMFFHNSNDLNEGFRRTAEAPEYMYVLGFSPQKLDGKLHKLKVKLKTPSKLDIQSREGYYALKSASK